MLRRFTQALNLVLLSLASGVVPLPKQSVSEIEAPLEIDFQNFEYSLGDFSSVIAESLLGDDLLFEGTSHEWSCKLHFGNPAQNYTEWIHDVELSCSRNNEHYIFPLGEGEFRRAYTKGRVLIRGEAAEALAQIMARNADDKSVESPISERTIAWGPSRSLNILTLRGSDISANLRASLECYQDADSADLHSCAVSY